MSASTHSDGYEDERLAGMRRRHERDLLAANGELGVQLAKLLREHEEAEVALELIAKKALCAKSHGSMGTTLIEIHDAAQTALQRPLEGTRVRCLMPHRGEEGTVVGWDRDLNVALVTWDDLSGLPPEGVEPGEYTTDLNREG